MLEIIKFKKVLSQLFIFMYYNFFEKEWTCLNHFILEFRFNQSFDLKCKNEMFPYEMQHWTEMGYGRLA